MSILGIVKVSFANGDGFTIQFPNKVALKSTLRQMNIDGGQIEEVLRQVALTPTEPNFWDIELP